MKNIVVIGSSNTDMVVKTSHLPAAGETVLGGEFMMNAGGKGANQAVAAARYGEHVVFVARVGDDMFGRQTLESLRRDGIDTSCVSVDSDRMSGVALISVNVEGENSIVVASGANMALGREDIDRAAEEIRRADVVLMQLEVPMATVEYAAEVAAAAGVPVILNPAPAPAGPLGAGLLSRIDVITPNRSEATRISGIEVTDMASARRAAEAIHAMGTRRVIITLGGEGSLIYDGGEFEHIGATRVEAVDTTAAGDTFNGVLAVGVAEGLSLARAAREASVAAAISVTRMGAQTAAPTRAEVEAFISERR
ncbi:MAG: ribokinase [Alistipes sp.]|nr:ribokinase [Alistipes sp.]